MSNVEVEVINWLESVVTGWAVSGDKPDPTPNKFILVDRTGGPRESMVLDRAEILIEVYHKDSRLEASNKANEIADLIPSILEQGDDITHAKVNSVFNLDDVIGLYHRYQVYCDIYVRR